jgi:hypothetical protein
MDIAAKNEASPPMDSSSGIQAPERENGSVVLSRNQREERLSRGIGFFISGNYRLAIEHYKEYLKWLEEGNEPLPPDPIPEPEPLTPQQKTSKSRTNCRRTQITITIKIIRNGIRKLE